MTNDELLEYTEENYAEQNALISRTMINYYTVRNLEDKTEGDEYLEQTLFDKVLELFDVMSKKIAEDTDGDADELYESLKEIHIKT